MKQGASFPYNRFSKIEKSKKQRNRQFEMGKWGAATASQPWGESRRPRPFPDKHRDTPPPTRIWGEEESEKVPPQKNPRIKKMSKIAFSRNAVIWKRCALQFRGGYANSQLRAAFLSRVLAVLRFLFGPSFLFGNCPKSHIWGFWNENCKTSKTRPKQVVRS